MQDRRRCAGCHQSLASEALVVVAANRLWHPDHLTCSSCKRQITERFQERGDEAYCTSCYIQIYNPKCARCQEALVDTCLLALDRHWHPRCFVCSSCNRPLPNGEFYLVDDKPYDLQCHYDVRIDKIIFIGKIALMLLCVLIKFFFF